METLVPSKNFQTFNSDVEDVAAAILAIDPEGALFARVLRETLDKLYDGQRTGRYRWDQLYKSERTHGGTLVEINLQREFRFADGEALDFKIAGYEVDCTFAQSPGLWRIPPEALNHICLMVSADDAASKWSACLLRAPVDRLDMEVIKDGIPALGAKGGTYIRWLFRESILPPNILLQLYQENRTTLERVLALPTGQKRIIEIFGIAERRLVGRGAVTTLGKQNYTKGIRKNDGARTVLRKQGIVILGQCPTHVEIAQVLGLTLPGKGEFVSVRVAPVNSPCEGAVEINGSFWRAAQPDDPVVNAPILPCA